MDTIVPATCTLHPGQQVWVWRPDFTPALGGAALNPPAFWLGAVEELKALSLSAGLRRLALQTQGTYLADDQLAGALARIAGACHNVQFVDPLLMMKCVQDEDPEPLRPLGAAFTREVTVITAVPLRGHWVTFAWDIRFLRFEAWDSCPVGILDVEVSLVHRIWGKVLGFRRRAPAQPPVPGLCGHFAIADLWCYLRGTAPPDPDGALALAATLQSGL